MSSESKPESVPDRDPTGEKASSADPRKIHQEKKEYQIDIFRDWCKSCGICTAFCPRHCIELDESGSPFIKDEALCSGCGWCELHCPDFAISVRPKATPGKSGDLD